jgi:hypothetical protein
MNCTLRSIVFATLAIGYFATQSHAQVVQLPSIRTFSYSGTVLVPDSGSAYLGGNYSGSASSQRRFGSQAAGVGMGVAGASVRTTIIDLDAMDGEILGADPKSLRGPHNTSRPATMAERTEEGKQLVRFARAQFRSGNQGAAFDAYRMAIDLLQGELRELATSEFRRVFPTASVQVAIRQ